MEVSCDLCFHEYDEELRVPKLLECGHTLCSSCADQMLRTRLSIHCPECRLPTRSPSGNALNTNVALARVLRQLVSLSPPSPIPIDDSAEEDHLSSDSHCIKHKVELSFCKDCSEAFCNKCHDIVDHRKEKHAIIPYILALDEIRYKFGQYHNDLTSYLLREKKALNLQKEAFNKAIKQVEDRENLLSAAETSLDDWLHKVRSTLQVGEAIRTARQALSSHVATLIRSLGHVVWAEQRVSGTEVTRWARVGVTQSKKLLLHSLQYVAPQMHQTIVPYSELRGDLVFMDVAVDGIEKGRVTMKINTKLPRGRNLRALFTGEMGVSLSNTPFHEGRCGYDLIFGDYENKDGSGGKAVIQGDMMRGCRESDSIECKPGLLHTYDDGDDDSIMSLTYIQIKVDEHEVDDNRIWGVIGEVEEGLDVLTGISQYFDEDEQPTRTCTITACGVVVDPTEY